MESDRMSRDDRLSDYEFMMGPARGRLALALDELTDLMAMLAAHKVHCRVEKGPRAGQGSLDLEQAIRHLERTKRLIHSVNDHLGPDAVRT